MRISISVSKMSSDLAIPLCREDVRQNICEFDLPFEEFIAVADATSVQRLVPYRASTATCLRSAFRKVQPHYAAMNLSSLKADCVRLRGDRLMVFGVHWSSLHH